MFASIILLACFEDLLTTLALCLIPFILGWLAAYAYYKVPALRNQVADLNARNGQLDADLTDARLRIASLEAEVENRNGQIAKLRNDLIICEGERMSFKEQLANLGVAAGGRASASAPAPEKITFLGNTYKWDELKIVEGIGPKIEALLHNGGIKTWRQLADAPVERLTEILRAAGPDYAMHNPATWPSQADMADRQAWDDLKKYQDELTAGRE